MIRVQREQRQGQPNSNQRIPLTHILWSYTLVSRNFILFTVFFLFFTEILQSKSVHGVNWRLSRCEDLFHEKSIPESRTDNPRVHAEPSAAASLSHRMKIYLQRYKYHPPQPNTDYKVQSELCGQGPDFSPYFDLDSNQRSSNGEDKLIYNMFFRGNNSLVKGTTVEMGAFNGKQESNSRFFEACLGWNTLLVEASPGSWKSLVVNRPHAHRLHFAPSCSEEEEAANKTIPFNDYSMTNAGQENVNTAYKGRRPVDVPCGSMTQVLLDLFPQGRVSFFSLDVEGAEPFVVQNIDFKKVFIEIMMIESRNNFCGAECHSRDQVRKMMKEAGYQLFKSKVQKSDLYIHPMSEYKGAL